MRPEQNEFRFYFSFWDLANHFEGSTTFDFLPMLATSSSSEITHTGSLCQEVPSLLGLHEAKSSKSSFRASVTRQPSSSNGGFYKRLLEWLSRKKKTRRRFSDIPLPGQSDCEAMGEDSQHLLVSISTPRNKSAPMIFDIQRSSPANRMSEQSQSVTCSETKDKSCQSEIVAITERQNSEEKLQEIDAEWIIPWNDIQVGQVITQGRSCTINRGRWHGDVIIHQFHLKCPNEIQSFWSDVQSLSKLRHENLLLFMGIATKNPVYSIVNGAPRGVSVIHFRLGLKNGKPERIGIRAAVSIGRQVAQATGYLHARGIVHGKLNPHNVFLEGDNYRVKLSLLDHGLVDTLTHKTQYGCISKAQVGYYSPELIRSIVVQPPEIRFTAEATKFSDVYAFGSFIYDLIAGFPPHHQEEMDSIIWRVGSGQTANLQEINCNARLKALIASCWSYDAAKRPSFVEVVRRLQPSALLCKSHSCSEPERLNRLGMCKLAC